MLELANHCEGFTTDIVSCITDSSTNISTRSISTLCAVWAKLLKLYVLMHQDLCWSKIFFQNENICSRSTTSGLKIFIPGPPWVDGSFCHCSSLLSSSGAPVYRPGEIFLMTCFCFCKILLECKGRIHQTACSTQPYCQKYWQPAKKKICV